MLATLARHYDCGIHPAYCVRLSCNRYRLTIEDKLALPRLAEDAGNIQATTQMLNDTFENWICEDPGRWI